MSGMTAFLAAKQRAEQQGGGSADFFSLKDGESKVLRFLTGLTPYYVVSHSCGIIGADMKKDDFDEAIAAGGQPKCPGCGQPLTMEDVLYERPDVVCADVHSFMPVANEVDKKTSFVCLASKTNADYGHVPADGAGQPLYPCPVCSCAANLRKEDGKPKKPSMRLYGVAIERDVVMGTEIVNGATMPVVTDVKDVMVDGHPKVVLVNMSFNIFWQQLGDWSPDFSQSICNFDWRVSRSGTGLGTHYSLQQLGNKPTVVDMREYAEWMPDIKAIVAGMGSPKYYTDKGYAVPGYVPQQEAAAPAALGQAAAGIAQAAAAVAQPQMAPQQMPQQVQQMQTATGNDWSVVQGQFS